MKMVICAEKQVERALVKGKVKLATLGA